MSDAKLKSDAPTTTRCTERYGIRFIDAQNHETEVQQEVIQSIYEEWISKLLCSGRPACSEIRIRETQTLKGEKCPALCSQLCSVGLFVSHALLSFHFFFSLNVVVLHHLFVLDSLLSDILRRLHVPKKRRQDKTREKMKEKMKDRRREEKIKMRKKRKEMKEEMILSKNVSNQRKTPDELAQNVSKKNPFPTKISFSSRVQNLTVFSIIYMIRIRFFGPGELIQ